MQAVDPDVKAEDAQTKRSAVEPEPAWRAATKLGSKDQTSEPELQAVDPDVKTKDAQTKRSAVELEPAVKVVEATAKAEDSQKSPSVGNVVAKVTKAQNARNATEC